MNWTDAKYLLDLLHYFIETPSQACQGGFGGLVGAIRVAVVAPNASVLMNSNRIVYGH
jgi:hypothetical protein